MSTKVIMRTAASLLKCLDMSMPFCTGLFGLFLFLGTLTACSFQEEATQKVSSPAIPVIISEAKQQDVPLYFESLGTLQPSVLVEVRPQVSGMLQEVHFTEGQQVHKGDPLFTIDSSEYEIRLKEAESQLAQNQAALDSAKGKANRFRSLSKKDLIPQQEWDEINAQVAKMEAQVLGDEAKVASAKLNLQRCVIAAPIDGRTGKVIIHPGNLLSGSQTTLVTLSNVNELVFDFTLTEREFQQLTPEHQQGSYPIEICSFHSFKNVCKGTLTFFDSSFDVETGLLHLQGKVANEHQHYLPGQHVRVRVPILVKHDLIVIPQKAVKINQTGPYVFAVKPDNTVEIRQVKLGDEIEASVVVMEGLIAGDKVVTEGHLRLAPGLAVEIKSTEQ